MDGGGALLNQGIHTVDLLQYLMGSVTSVHAHTRTIGHEHIDVEDIATAVLTYADGGIGTLFATTCAYPGLQTRIEIFGQQGSAILENNELVYVASRDGESDWSHLAEQRVVNWNKKTANPEDAVGTAHRLQLQDLIDAIDQDREPIVNGEEGAKPLQIILSAYASASKGLPIYL
ncbi:Gfo/Idh/MocA family protein [Paenibacillus sp. MAH-36]|uniref:Gfo/Idh/MocA family oxidoreductase n=1 Tax=Paenibacillus violae TaxID=3077234 RepID=A0ABU3RD25_9BACL|nr:Gfo/Idh/MocA family oxidoreductase [Paenibacillus sp. PFR10]MDU0202162.1 Gfo/Idh/MocA family oxidoreductase [Paenibacillus sp. PFR10]